MSEWLTLSRQQNVNHFFLPRKDYFFSAENPVVPILAGELRQALTQFVMGFIKRGDRFVLVALLGKGARSHYYLHPDDGHWLGTYVPAAFRGHPFRLAKQQSTGERVLQLHVDHLSEDSGEPLFDSQGALSDSVSQQLKFLGECATSRQQTEEACQKLAAVDVFQPWSDNLFGPNVTGLFQIDDQKLNNLPDQDFLSLKGLPLTIAHAQLFSMAQQDQLTQRSELQSKLMVPESLDSMFEGHDEDFYFDF